MNLLVDSHCHILDERVADRAEEIVANFEKDGIAFVVEIGATYGESIKAVAFAKKHEKVFATIGIHPHYAGGYFSCRDCEDNKERHSDFEVFARGQKENKKVVAIGECGLDYYHMHSDRASQKEAFIRQIKLAHELGLPLVVHSRDAFQDTFDILWEHKDLLKNEVLLHCFSYGVPEVSQFLRLQDAYFAFGGAITYKNVDGAKQAVLAVPRDRLLIETDSPYLSPVPLRGSTNEPKNVKYVAEKISEILGISYNEVCRQTHDNAKRFYDIN